MNNNELENIETIDLGGNVAPATEPAVTNVETPVQTIRVAQSVEPIVNPQAATLNKIETNVINAESNFEAQMPSTSDASKNPESLGTIITESGEKVDVTPVKVKSTKETFLPLILLAVGLLGFILLIPKLSEIFNGI